MRWVTLFSQSGSEIYNLSLELGRLPDIILTNNMNRETWNHGIHLVGDVVVNKHLNLMDIVS